VANLNGKVAVVTGASKGIGAGIAKVLAKAGASVVANYAGSRQSAETVVEQINADGGTAIAVQADVSRADDVERLFRSAVDAFGRVSILVNNAGIFEFGPVDTITEERFQRLYATNVWGSIQTTQRALKCFHEDGGSIINISSGVTRMLAPGSALYAGTKGALDLITVVLSKELGPRKIRVNAISPGATDTEGAHAVGAMTGQAQERYASLTPLGRVGKPKDIAQLAVFLASDESSWITGEVIHASGGLR
jgi:3-oxoacyl-[acyl-carrier protein] reductase